MIHAEYIRPQSVQEALSVLADSRGKIGIIAGGTDLMIHYKQNRSIPENLMAIESLADLNFVENDDEKTRIGAVTRLYALEGSAAIRDRYPALHQAVKVLATPTLRRQATVGGNLCNASPAADLAPPLIVLGATLKAVNSAEERIVPIEMFFNGPGETCLGADELLTEIRIPAPAKTNRSVFLKMTRSQGVDLTLVSVAVSLEMEEQKVKDIKIALGAVAPRPVRVETAERFLLGENLNEENLEQAALAAVAESKPIDDVRCSAAYRKKLIRVMVRRAILDAASKEC